MAVQINAITLQVRDGPKHEGFLILSEYGGPGLLRPSTILLISRLTETVAPVLSSNATPLTYEVSISASWSALAVLST